MMGTLILDTNLLILFVVGATSTSYISKHKRLQKYRLADYNLLSNLILNANSVIVTPNVLTETSNLLPQIDEPAKSEIMRKLLMIVQSKPVAEEYFSSKVLVEQGEFFRLGLADVSLLQAGSEDRTLLTDDVGVYLAHMERGWNAVNFTHLRERAGTA